MRIKNYLTFLRGLLYSGVSFYQALYDSTRMVGFVYKNCVFGVYLFFEDFGFWIEWLVYVEGFPLKLDKEVKGSLDFLEEIF